MHLANAFVVPPPASSSPSFLQAKRKKNQRDDDFSSWYDDVGENASPDDVFWEEMERQRRLTDVVAVEPVAVATQAPPQSIGLKQEKSADATLAEYAAFMVDDNWLDEELAVLMEGDVGDYQDFDLEEQNRAIDEEFQEMNTNGSGGDNAWMTSDEPWDHWGEVNDPDTRDVLKLDPNKGACACHVNVSWQRLDKGSFLPRRIRVSVS